MSVTQLQVCHAVLAGLITQDDILGDETRRGFQAISQARWVTWWVYSRLVGATPAQTAKVFEREPKSVKNGIDRVLMCPALLVRAEGLLASLKASTTPLM